MNPSHYIMESEEESVRLDLKTKPETVKQQALWAGLKSGMRVADLGCGSGKTSYCLNQMVKPDGSVVGVDISKSRVSYATSHYQDDGLVFLRGDIREPLNHLGEFDFVWIRFVLEHNRSTCFDIVNRASQILKKDGVLCLIDLDHNCLSHYGLSPKLESSLFRISDNLTRKADFDPYVGRKLYAFLYDLGYKEIQVDISAHHILFGHLNEIDAYNWRKKAEIAAKVSHHLFDDYEDGIEGFMQDFNMFISSQRRFTYTPLIACRGLKA